MDCSELYLALEEAALWLVPRCKNSPSLDIMIGARLSSFESEQRLRYEHVPFGFIGTVCSTLGRLCYCICYKLTLSLEN